MILKVLNKYSDNIPNITEALSYFYKQYGTFLLYLRY